MSKLVEEWRPVVGYEGLYEVSDWGRVKRVSRLMLDSKNRKTLLKEKIIHQYYNNEGYKIVVLSKDKCKKWLLVHRLVAKAFIPNPENKHDVGHLKTLPNGLEDRTANEAWNIAWMTQGENANYGTRNERISKAKRGKYKHSKGFVWRYEN